MPSRARRSACDHRGSRRRVVGAQDTRDLQCEGTAQATIARRSGLIYEVTVVDLAPGDEAAIEEHRRGQCEGLTKKLTPQHHPDLVASVYALRERLEQMPLQLYAQCVVTFDLLWKTLSHATAYYSQREPRSLALFRWVIDAKSPDGVTGSEDWWSKVVRPFMQSRSLQEPFPELESGDYSHLAAKEMPIPDYLVKECTRLKRRDWADAERSI
jgi:hypothetical protein